MISNQLELTSIKRDWIDESIPKVLHFCRGLKSFESADLHDMLGEPMHPNWFGILFARLRKAGLIEHVGFGPSKNKASNGSAVYFWKLV